MSEPHGWVFIDAARLVHSGPLHLVRVIFRSNNKGDRIKAYDGLSAQGRQIFEIGGVDEDGYSHDLGVRLTTGLYVTLSTACHATLVFDPLGDE